jgi:pyruvate/2-oxoglutarate dehydrogenase complex dihydrolipoamide acyltransferase (E2) component
VPAERIGVKTIPLAPIRARIAENMVLSKKTIPHAGCSVDVDLKLIETWRSSQEKAPSYVIFAISSVIKALKVHPLINAAFKAKDGKHWIEEYENVNMGIAVATEQGLMVPVIRNAQKLSFREIEKEMVRLVEGGRKGTLKVDDLTGATITVNNTGAVGAVRTQQIVPPTQSSIIAFNKVVKRPWAVGDKVEVRPIMGLDIMFDHRIIDGDHAGRFLTDVAKNLENFDFSQIG